MTRIISLEGCIGVGKTTLTNYLSSELGIGKILEEYEGNPFLKEFYAGHDVAFEATTTFLLMHYSQMRKAINNGNSGYILADFSIQKDWVYAEMNLDKQELEAYRGVYDYIIHQAVVPHIVIYMNLSLEKLRERIIRRGRSYEVNTDFSYFAVCNDRFREYFETNNQNEVLFFNTDDLELRPNNGKLGLIRNTIIEFMEGEAHELNIKQADLVLK